MNLSVRAALPIMLAACIVSAQAREPDALNALAWMAGDWGSRQDGAWTEEHWLRPRGGLMLGTNRSGDEQGAKAFEFLRIVTAKDGVPVYWAAPSGGSPTPFRLIESGPRSATFENLANAYPTRISYRRSGEIMTAAIEGPNGAQPMSWTWRRLPPHR
jgi:hypothetical protein